MGKRLWLPTRSRLTGGDAEPYPFPQGEREELMNRLYHTRTLLPGARDMEINELRDVVEAQETKQREGHYDRVAPSRNTKPLTPTEVAQAKQGLKALIAWRRWRKDNPTSRRYY